MSVTIIGPGNMGLGLAKLLVEQGQAIVLAHRDVLVAEKAAKELGVRATAADMSAAVRQSDVIILATPFGAVGAALAAAGDLAGKVVIDITNPITPDYMALTIGHTTSAAEQVAALAPGARIVKAFNTIFWQILPFGARRGKSPVQVLLASDDAAAKATVSELVELLEFEAVDAGPLANARYLEPVGELNIHFGYALGWGTSIAPSWVRL